MEGYDIFFEWILNKRLVLLGVGSNIRGDDGVGPYLAEKLIPLNSKNFLSINGGLVPENFTSDIRKFSPDVVIIVDAAFMDKPVGDFEVIKVNESKEMSFSSHSMPLSILGKYISGYIGSEVYLLGIQAATVYFGNEISPEVKETADRIFEIIEKKFNKEE